MSQIKKLKKKPEKLSIALAELTSMKSTKKHTKKHTKK